MIKIADRRWREIVLLAEQLAEQPTYTIAGRLFRLLAAIDATQPLRASDPHLARVVITDIATGKPVSANQIEMPLDDLRLGDD
jgi:hypothetical protein